jgi:dTDP-4-amino-4,6-dideoxygalactose transaminase
MFPVFSPMKKNLNRRNFLKSATQASAGAVALRYAAVVGMFSANVPNIFAGETDLPVKLGGKPVRTTLFPTWPVYDETEEKALLDVLHSKKWFRGEGQHVNQFEAAFMKLTGAKHCVATANGTSAVLASLGALDVGPGDEVIVPPYTFVATINAVLMHHALPVFVDTDPETFQIDAKKIEAAITDRTVAIMPVHVGGSPADLDTILEIGARRKIPVIEDACQAHLAEWRGKKVGTYGVTGCFSFQASKNLTSGEGGAVITNDDELAERLYSFHNNCRARKTASYNFTYRGTRGANLRLAEFQGALLLAQLARLETQAKTRDANAAYLAKQLAEIPGIVPAKNYDGCTRSAHHLFMLRYGKDQFAGLPRAKFLAAMADEGIPCSGGYSPLNIEPFIQNAFKTRAYQRVYAPDVLAGWAERTRCPDNDKICEEAVWFTQNMMLGSRADMDDIVAAVKKIHSHAAELAKG